MKKFLLTLLLAAAAIFGSNANANVWFYKELPPSLIRASGKKVNTRAALQGKTVLFYFSAAWCGPCRTFTPQLIKFYKQTARRENLEIVFVSSDKSAEEMKKYMKKSKMPFLAVPYNSPARQKIYSRSQTGGIPRLTIYNSRGKMLTNNGRWDVVMLGRKAAAAWKSPKYKALTYEDYMAGENKGKKSKKDKRKN